MITKRLFILLPLLLIGVLFQSFFWVPTYDKQATVNPERLTKFIESSGGDARILNPIRHADSASNDIVSKVFDGLLDQDDQLDLRPRLAESWTQYEEAYLTLALQNLPDKNLPVHAKDWVPYNGNPIFLSNAW